MLRVAITVLLLFALFLVSTCQLKRKARVDTKCQIDDELVRMYAERMHLALEELHEIEEQVKACIEYKDKAPGEPQSSPDPAARLSPTDNAPSPNR